MRCRPWAPLTSPSKSGTVQTNAINGFFTGISYPARSGPIHWQPSDLTVYLTVPATCCLECTVMPLSDKTARNAKGRVAPNKLFDGGGLYLLVRPDGARYWRMDYRHAGKRRTLALGIYPTTTLAVARARREDARVLLAQGADPSAAKKAKRRAALQASETTFEVIAREWLHNQ